ncbi:BON domain-containing protein [Altererythrobacter sp. KTW20L]|uniref:BON domain-containing protein n=1 Tax=Altererythrobacter sp. KTW20L TaxID=2942210 RepID=UPI0020C047B9|nr:BON domain-containing protein [Altererythrobacter sp. KTW20L]MCL6251224.1 BON domain-containing protein [Altererythrobacter sp. KTW20L]
MKTDSELQRDVLDELEWDPSVDHADIGVSVVDGVVALNGYVKSYAEKIAAERAAKRVAGVKAIAEELNVRYASDAKTADHEIAKRILDLFKYNILIPEEHIVVKVEKGWVSLTGDVEWNFQSDEATKAAGKVSGVVGVSNNLTIRNRASAIDIRKRIKDAFERQAGLDAATVTITTSGNKVTLGGKVKAWHERKLAEDAAWSAPGVTQVEDRILVS